MLSDKVIFSGVLIIVISGVLIYFSTMRALIDICN